MKKYMITFAIVLSMTTSFAQQSKDVRKDDKKQEKLDRKSTEMEHATRNNNGKKSLKKLHKMEKKEDKLNKKSEK